jgi:transcriptional regulator with XRE-family HTH domain
MLVGMPATDRLFDRGTRLGDRRLRDLGEEYRDKRMELGLSQLSVARAARIPRSTYSRIERAKRPSLTVVVASRVAAVLGLDLVLRTYPGGEPLRDAASAGRIKFVCDCVGPPLRWKTEVPLRPRAEYPEQRRWDIELTGAGRRTVIEFESRIHDAQGQRGRWNLKLRDDPADSFVVVVAETRRNLEVLRRFESLFADLPRMSSSAFLTSLRSGEHPPTGLVLLANVPHGHHPNAGHPGDPAGSP